MRCMIDWGLPFRSVHPQLALRSALHQDAPEKKLEASRLGLPELSDCFAALRSGPATTPSPKRVFLSY